MPNFTSAHTGNEIDLTVASGSTTTGVIRDFNTLSGSSTSTINVGGTINTLSHITASGNISLSGTLIAAGANFNEGDISNVGSIDADSFRGDANGDNKITITSDTMDLRIEDTSVLALTENQSTFTGHITASGNISSSGTVIADDITATDVTGISTIYNTDLKIGGDNQTQIDFATENNAIIIKVNNSNKLKVSTSGFFPFTDNGVGLGLATRRWSDLFLAEGGVINFDAGDAVITQTGPLLTISGSGGTGLSVDGHITASGNISGSATSTINVGGNITSLGTITAAAAVLTTADINGGTVDGITSLTAGGNLDIGSHGFRAATITADGLTATRVPFAGANGLLSDDSDLTFATATLSATNLTTTGTIKDFALVSGSLVSTGSFGRVETGKIDIDSITGDWTNAGNTVADLGTITTVDIDGGSITGITDLVVADGGTGAGTFTDGGILLGSGVGAITAMAVLTDGQMIVGDGTTDPVAESGATLRTSIGVGTGDDVQFTTIGATGKLNVTGSGANGTGSFSRLSTTDLDLTAIKGNWTNAGNTVADLGTITTANIDGGNIDGATIATSDVTVGSGKTLNVSAGTLTTSTAQKLAIVQGVGGDTDIGAHDLRAGTVTADGLTATRVVFAGTNGVLSDDSDLTFATATLSATNLTTTGTIKDFGLISGSLISTGSFGRVETADGSIFGNRYVLSTQTVAAAGSNQGDAALINVHGGSTVFVTGANTARGVRLPVVANSIIGQTFTIHNVDTDTLKVYPGSGDKILPAADNTAIELAGNCAVIVTHFSADGFVGYEPAVIVSD